MSTTAMTDPKSTSEPKMHAPASSDGPVEGSAGNPDPGSEPYAEALLGQDEIDSLFFVSKAAPELSGIPALVSKQSVSYEGARTLEVVMDRFIRNLSTSLRKLTSENVELTLEAVISLRLGDYLDSLPVPAMIAVFRAVEWEGCGLLTLSSHLVYSIIEVLLGGRSAFDARRIDGRPFTGIERVLTKRLTGVLLRDMAAAFAPLGAIEFRLEQLETNPRHAAIGRPTDGATLFRIKADMKDRGGRFEIVLPHAALEPVRDLLLQKFGGEKLGSNSLWAAHLWQQTLMSSIELEAVLEEQIVPLAEVMGLAVGTTLRLNASADTSVILRRGHVPVLRGQMGRVGDRIAIRIEERLARDQTSP